MKPGAREILALSVSLIVPLIWMGLRWFTGLATLPVHLIGLMLLEATVQAWLIALVRSDRLSPRRYRLLFFTAGLILGMPATVLCVYMGILPEFRLVPFFIILLERYGRAQAYYSLALFLAGVLLFFPLFEGKLIFLGMELFRPLFALASVFLLFHLLGREREKWKKRLWRIRQKRGAGEARGRNFI